MHHHVLFHVTFLGKGFATIRALVTLLALVNSLLVLLEVSTLTKPFTTHRAEVGLLTIMHTPYVLDNLTFFWK